jgi:GMP synthase-like glutamine amidotransferase
MKLGLLNCYHWDGQPDSYQARYRDLWADYLSPFLSTTDALVVYELPRGHFPESVHDCDGWIIGGSGKSCYEHDGWILRLQDWVRTCAEHRRRLLGICFGHQIIAKSLGGEVSKSKKGWGIGVRSFHFDEIPQWYAGNETEWMKQASLIFSHQDQVDVVPNNVSIIARDEFCPVQSFTVGRHIFTLQGHPEYTPAFARSRLLGRESVFGENVFNKAILSLGEQAHAKAFRQMIMAFFRP